MLTSLPYVQYSNGKGLWELPTGMSTQVNCKSCLKSAGLLQIIGFFLLVMCWFVWRLFTVWKYAWTLMACRSKKIGQHIHTICFKIVHSYEWNRPPSGSIKEQKYGGGLCWCACGIMLWCKLIFTFLLNPLKTRTSYQIMFRTRFWYPFCWLNANKPIAVGEFFL